MDKNFGDFEFPDQVVIVALCVLVGAVTIGGLYALSGLIVWALWNALVPALVGGPAITYIQGVLLSVAMTVVGGVLGRRR